MVTVQTVYGPITYLKNDVFIASFFQNNTVPGEQMIHNVLKPYLIGSRVALDCGAHIGCHSVIYKSINPKLQLHAFELQTNIYKILRKNLQHHADVKTYNCAVGNRIETVCVSDKILDGPGANQVFSYENEHNFGGVQIGQSGSEEKIMISIDMLQLDCCDFIKIDVEGCELPVICGALQTIIKHRPVIFYENNFKTMTDDMQQLTGIPKDDGQGVLRILAGLGYKFDRIEENILARPV